MPVRTVIDIENDITEHIASGSVLDEEMFGAQEEFYGQGPTRLQLWDMSESSVSSVTVGGMRKFIEKAAKLGRARENGRTAVIVGSELQYGLGRMSESIADLVSIPFAFHVFKEREKALAWFNEETEDDAR